MLTQVSDSLRFIHGPTQLTNMHTQAGYLASSQATALRMLYPQLAYANYPGNLTALALASQGQYPYEYAAHTLANHMNLAMDAGLNARKSMNLSPNSSISDGKDDRYKHDAGKFRFMFDFKNFKLS